MNWHENIKNFEPFVKYILGVIVAEYRDFESRVEILITKGLSKPERVAEIIKGTLGKITTREILEKCPDICDVTVQRALKELHKNGNIIKISGGRYTTYTWNREKES